MVREGSLRWAHHGARARPAFRGTTGTGFVLSPFLGPISRFSFTPCELSEALEMMDSGANQV